MENNWSTVRGQGRASRIAQRGRVRGGVSSRLDPDVNQGDNRGGRSYRGGSGRQGRGFPGGLPTFLSFLSNIVPGQGSGEPAQGGRGATRGYGPRGPSSRRGPSQGWRGPPLDQRRPGWRRPAEQDQGSERRPRGPEPRPTGSEPRPTGPEPRSTGPEPRPTGPEARPTGPWNRTLQDQPTTGIVAQLASSLKALQDGLNAIQQQFNAFTSNQKETTNPTGQRTTTDNRQQDPSGEESTRSGNTDFSQLCKTTFRYVQICHHMENWQNLPNSIGKNINTLIHNIKPPMPSCDLTDKLTAIGLDFGHKIAEAVKSHL